MLTVTLGPLTMALNHLLMLTALVIASVVGWWVARRGGESPESALFNLFLIGLLCARAGFVLAYWPMYRDEPLQMIDIRDGGFLLWTGLVGIVFGALWQGWRHPGLRRPLGWALFIHRRADALLKYQLILARIKTQHPKTHGSTFLALSAFLVCSPVM